MQGKLSTHKFLTLICIWGRFSTMINLEIRKSRCPVCGLIIMATSNSARSLLESITCLVAGYLSLLSCREQYKSPGLVTISLSSPAPLESLLSISPSLQCIALQPSSASSCLSSLLLPPLPILKMFQMLHLALAKLGLSSQMSQGILQVSV